MALLYDRLAEVVCRYLSPVNAHAILKQVIAECRKTPDGLREDDLSLVLPKLERALVLFLDTAKRAALRADIEKVAKASTSGPETARVGARRVEIKKEQDITEARLLGRQMCLDLKARSLAIQKVATVVSELARNIVSYTQGGYVELVPQLGVSPTLVIRSVDTGPGIPNLEQIMSGGYKSKTGLGLGILGTKRLADQFDIQSDARGTRIEVSVRL